MLSQEFLDHLTCGNRDAAAFLFAAYDFIHVLDALFDRDCPVTADQLAETATRYSYNLLLNPFVQQHKAGLAALLFSAASGFAASETNLKGTPARDYIKSLYFELFVYVAFLCGGWRHAQEIGQKVRQYDLETGNEPV